MSDDGLIKRQAFRISGQLRPSHVVPRAPAAPPATVPAAIPMATSYAAPALREPPAPAVPAITPAEIEQLKQAARAEGLALGRQQGQQEVEAAARDRLAALEAMVTKVSTAWEAERERMHELLTEFAFVCTNRLLGDCLRDPGMAASAVRAALAACDGWQQLTLEVHAGDLALIQGVVHQDPVLSQKALRVVASSAVQVGGCRVTSDEGSLDARLEVQLSELRKQLDALRAAGSWQL
jgi:flagellar biosynthesis/type III secretory pathway protein FliH